jgi:hypothetical protein
MSYATPRLSRWAGAEASRVVAAADPNLVLIMPRSVFSPSWFSLKTSVLALYDRAKVHARDNCGQWDRLADSTLLKPPQTCILME